MTRPRKRIDNRVCLGKRRFSDEAGARALGMTSIAERPWGVSVLWVYRCPHCDGWHLTKNRRKEPAITADNPVTA